MFLKLIALFLVLFTPQVDNSSELTCDSLKHKPFDEGNLGQTGIMPWLGVIRAHLHFGRTTNIAVTGAILIKPKHAIANADDMSKIRKQGDSKAMFITQDRGPWTCKLSEVSVHPEYDFATYNTIALVELDTESLTSAAPMLPICMPKYMYNASNQLYVIGFTDENKLLEKIAFKVEYVEKALCDEFYSRAGHMKGMYTPVLYECAFAVNSVKNCDWENGMALISNASGYWVLVGFSVQGPGCSAPARFIDVYPYQHWLESASNIEDFDAEYPFKVKVRRSEFLPAYENFTDIINATNFFKREHKPLNITFREFLKQKEYENKMYGEQKNDNETLDVIDATNYLKRDHEPLSMTFRNFLKKRKDTKQLGEEKRDDIKSGIVDDMNYFKINHETMNITLQEFVKLKENDANYNDQNDSLEKRIMLHYSRLNMKLKLCKI